MRIQLGGAALPRLTEILRLWCGLTVTAEKPPSALRKRKTVGVAGLLDLRPPALVPGRHVILCRENRPEIVATEDRSINPELEREMAKRAGSLVTEIKSSTPSSPRSPKSLLTSSKRRRRLRNATNPLIGFNTTS